MLVRCLAMMRGGGETRHLAWARELAALGVEVEVITGVPLVSGEARYPTDAKDSCQQVSDTSQTPPVVNVQTVRSPYARDFVYRCQNRRGFGRLTMTALHLDEEWFCRAAWRRIAASTRRPDVVHAHALHQAARLRVGAMPVVINLPGAPNPRYAADLREADALVADGWAASNLPATLGTAVERLPKGVDSERFRPDGPSARERLGLAGKRVVLTVARLVPIKNVQRLLDAMALVRAQLADAHLVIVGDGPEAGALHQHAAALGITDAVTFAGYLPHAETPDFYRAADVFALSSDFDNSPNVVLEAMASALPVVTTDVGGVRELVADRTGATPGAIVVPSDPAALAAGLEQYLAAPDAARAAGADNRNRAVTEFSWRTSALRLLDVYHRVVSARRAA
jgi:glycosyltransferase involved in cell wall biosynthesis